MHLVLFTFLAVISIAYGYDGKCSKPRLTPAAILDVIMANYSRYERESEVFRPRKSSRSLPSGTPVPVQVEVTVQDVMELSVLSNSFTADIWFSSIWYDPRLAYSHLDNCRQNLSFDDRFEKVTRN